MARRESSTDPRAVRTREALLSATKQLLNDHPVDKLSVSQIVKAARVSRQVFYEHFIDKNGVILAAAEDILLPAYEEFADHFINDSSYVEQVTRLVAHMHEYDAAIKHLIESSVHGVLNRRICEVMVNKIAPKLEASFIEEGVEYNEETLQDTARFLVVGTQEIFIAGMRYDLDAEETARRVANIQHILSQFSFGRRL